MKNSFDTRATLSVSGRDYDIARISALENRGYNPNRLPFALKILLENLLRREDGNVVPASDIEALLGWDSQAAPTTEIAFMPARVLLQDFTGVPAIVDLAAMRDAMVSMGGDPTKINPLQPAELVIDHSVQVDEYGTQAARLINAEKEFERNEERYLFLRWGQSAFENFRVVPPDTGIVHQVNLEYLARGVMGLENGTFAYPDTLVGTDSHTTMINGLGVLGWGVGGIEAEAAMLGQPISMLIPQVVGFRLVGELRAGSTATDLVLRVVELLREKGVVGKFVEFFGSGLAGLRLADRATIANMAPEYGATCGIFPIDAESISYLRFTGRSEEQVALAEAYAKEQGLFHSEGSPEPEYSDLMELDLSTVVPSLAGPKRPQDRIELTEMKEQFLGQLSSLQKGGAASGTVQLGGVADETAIEKGVTTTLGGETFELRDGSVVIAAITSCTNTSNPDVMVAAGLLAKKAVEAGLMTKPWVKTSLAPGSKVVTEYLEQAGLMTYLEQLKFNTVGYGCTTCIGNSGPLREPISKAIAEGELVATSVLSGNRNFEGRISPEVRANYLASPPLVVAFALAGRVDIDMDREPLGEGSSGPVFLRDLWPSSDEIKQTVENSVRAEMFREQYASVFEGSEEWRELAIPEGKTYQWAENSTYVRLPPFFVDLPREAPPVENLEGARVLALLGDSVTTDHISPAGAIAADSPAGRYLLEHGVARAAFNSYGSRRGNHEVMMRGTFANVRLRNRLVPGVEGGFTRHFGSDEQMSIYDAAMKYQQEGIPLVVLAGSEYGTGSSRDWAAKGSTLLGVRAVIATGFERIHRSNLIGMGVAPIEFRRGDSADSLGLSGEETFSINGLAEAFEGGFSSRPTVTISATGEGRTKTFDATLRLDTPQEGEYYRNGGILQYVLRDLLAS